jgi:hypothetical protein
MRFLKSMGCPSWSKALADSSRRCDAASRFLLPTKIVDTHVGMATGALV